jgi:putative ABC transport system ATP-binding protein
VPVEALGGVDLEICSGEHVAVLGSSGCGKSTLLAMLGGLDRPTSGKVYIGGTDLSELSDDGLAEMRRRIGFVFQFFNLVQSLDARENVELSMSIVGVPRAKRRARAEELLRLVGLGDRMDHYPRELSGGEQQRVAIARALANDPSYLLMDEPTGNLDSKNSMDIMQLIMELNHRKGTTIILITHDLRISQYANRVIYMMDGRIGDQLRARTHG